eukprot:CAMPEP_0115518004 /NCGR_PEP_ID=MMETSP0271-20121206/77634_1 /TAXON_ID=71861 /ORGANISM="Scrippsiella trochoidea, Strain CCMP3099" /LENGTH=33 /DNA_ID= /DNA_START= /DNA_END= /DNA_ORIENTATION=
MTRLRVQTRRLGYNKPSQPGIESTAATTQLCLP